MIFSFTLASSEVKVEFFRMVRVKCHRCLILEGILSEQFESHTVTTLYSLPYPVGVINARPMAQKQLNHRSVSFP